MPIVPLFGTGFRSTSPNITAQRRVNMYLDPQDDQDKTPVALVPTPGLTLFTTFGAIIRGMRTVGSTLYVVAGSSFYSVTNSGVVAQLNTLSTSTGRVSMSDNGTQLIMVDGSQGYVYNTSNGNWNVIVDVNFPNGATTVCFLGGYTIVNKPATGQFWWSNIYDSLTWNALQFATAESDPDNLLQIFSLRGELYLMGLVTTEVWSLSGDSAVFRRLGGAGLQWGVGAVNSVANYGNGIIFLAKNAMGQYQPVTMVDQQISPLGPTDIVGDINNRPGIQGATGFSYMISGHPMYQLNFSDKSYLYDASANAWSEVSSGTQGARHYADIKCELLGRQLVTDYRNGNLYVLDPNALTDNGDTIIREVDTKHVFHDLDFVSVRSFQVDIEPATVTTSANPQMMLQVSRDGGHTWGNERWASMGKIGQYRARAIWRNCGVARDFVFKIRVSDSIKPIIVGAAIVV